MPNPTPRILLAAVLGGVLFDVLVIGNAAGINAPIVLAAFLVVAFAIAGRDGIGRMDRSDLWLAPAALVLGSLVVVRADDWLVTSDLLLAAALAAGAVGCLAGGRITRGVVPRVLDLSVGLVASAAAGSAALLTRRRAAVDGDGQGDGDSAPGRVARLHRAAPVVRGVLIALPIVLVFGVLFASADAVFARLANDVLGWQPDIDVADLVTRAIVVGVVAWGAAGLLALGAGLLPSMVHPLTPAVPEPPASSADRATAPGTAEAAAADPGAAAPPLPPAAPAWPSAGMAGAATWGGTAIARPEPRPLRLGAIETATVLLVVDALFAVFVALQLAYLFGGRDTLALAGLTYADYARRGFFELVIVAILAGTLVMALHAVAAARSRLLLGASLVLLGLTAVVLLSALLRLRLYQEAYGWTELRFVVLTAILWLAAGLAIASILLVTDRTRWVLHALGVAVLVTVAGMNLVGPQAFVTQRNLDRAMNPALVADGGRTGLDAAYLGELGDEAVEPIVDAWDRLPAIDRIALRPVLEARDEALERDPALLGWPAWNLTRERAREALARWRAAGQ